MRAHERAISNRELLLSNLLLMLVAVALWLPLAFHNLPVAANVDERNGLVVLSHFHAGDANPHFFFYPTLYYYLDYGLTAFWGFSRELLAGRLLNLALVGASAAASLFLVTTATGSRLAGWCVALLILTSPVFAASGSYLNTDVLLAWSTAMSLAFFLRYFRERQSADWWVAIILCGVAFSCKYTALVLYFAYLVTELITPASEKKPETWLAKARIPSRTLLLFLVGLAVLFCAAAAFFPTHRAIHFIQLHRTNVNTKSAASYLTFFRSLRRKLLLAGLGLGVVAILTRRFPSFESKISLTRFYLGLLTVIAIMFITTPYGLITPVRFVYDAASLLKNNVDAGGGAHAQWGNYAKWFLTSESWLAGILSLAGMVLLRRDFSRWAILYVYVVIYVLVIGAAGRGFPRYLLALLPALYCFFGFVIAWVLHKPQGFWITAVAMLAIACWHGIHIVSLRRQSAWTDEAYHTFQVVKSLQPTTVFFAGNAPSEELRRAGYTVTELPWKEAASEQFWRTPACHEVAILDLHAPHPTEPLNVPEIQARAAAWTHVAGDNTPNSEDIYVTGPCR